MRRTPIASILAAGLVLVASACGGGSDGAPPPTTPTGLGSLTPATGPLSDTERAYLDQLGALGTSLDDALQRSQQVGGGVAQARALLRNQQQLLDSALAFSVFAGCEQILDNAGKPSPRLVPVRRSFATACSSLMRAADSFLRAIQTKKAATLVESARHAAAAAPLLARAERRLSAFRARYS